MSKNKDAPFDNYMMSKLRKKIRASVFGMVNHVDDEKFAEEIVDEIIVSVKKHTEEIVIDFILQERNRCRDICDSHSGWFERRIREFPQGLRKIYEEGKDACRRIRIGISDVSPLDIDNKTDQEKIKKEYDL